jgi:hypothetical protein
MSCGPVIAELLSRIRRENRDLEGAHGRELDHELGSRACRDPITSAAQWSNLFAAGRATFQRGYEAVAARGTAPIGRTRQLGERSSMANLRMGRP